MRQSSIHIQISGSDPKGVKASSQIFSLQEDGLTTSSASGILWDTDAKGVLLLAPATLFVPFLRQDCRHDLAASTMQSLSHNVRIGVTVASEPCQATFKGMFCLPDFSRLVERICSGASGWVCGWKLRSQDLQWASGWQHVAVLAIKPAGCQSSVFAMLAGLSSCGISSRQVSVGDEIQLCGSPFGCLAPAVFLDHTVRGTISAIPPQDSGQTSDVYFADLSSLPGMEGAAVFHRDLPIGMLMTPISHTKFDAEVPVIVSMQSLQAGWDNWKIQHTTAQICASPGSEPSLSGSQNLPAATQGAHVAAGPQIVDTFSEVNPPDPEALSQRSAIAFNAVRSSQPAIQAESTKDRSSVEAMREAVVAISHAGSWASGVLIGKGFILTVAHAMHLGDSGSALEVRIGMMGPSSSLMWQTAKLVYAFQNGLDLAVLRLQGDSPETWSKLPIARLLPERVSPGEPVLVIGHANFWPELGVGPSITMGNAAKVLHQRLQVGEEAVETDVMLITTASVYPGASGGGVFSRTGHLVGLVTSNSRLIATGAGIPKLNYSISKGVLSLICLAIARAGHVADALTHLDRKLASCRELWTLAHSLTDLQDPNRRFGGSDRLSQLLKDKGLLEILQPPTKSKL